MICSPSKAYEDSQRNSDSEEYPSMASSSTSDSLPVSSAVHSTKVLRDPIQTTEKCPYHYKIASYWAYSL